MPDTITTVYFDETLHTPNPVQTEASTVFLTDANGVPIFNNAKIAWDNVNDFLGVGNNSPSATVHVGVPVASLSAKAQGLLFTSAFLAADQTLNAPFQLIADDSGTTSPSALNAYSVFAPSANTASNGGAIDAETFLGGTHNATGLQATLYSLFQNYGSGTITQPYGLYVDSAANIGGGSITTNYGIFVNDQTAGGTNYALKTGAGTVSLGDGVVAGSATGGNEGVGTINVSDAYFINGTQTGCVFAQTQAVTVANTATETNLTGTGVGSLTLPAGFFKAGGSLVFTGAGIHSATGSPTIQIRIYAGSTVLLDTTAVSSGNSTNAEWDVRGFLTCYTTGAGGTVWAQGRYTETGGGSDAFGMANAAAISLDTTASQVLKMTVQWGTAALGNTITMSNFTIESLVP